MDTVSLISTKELEPSCGGRGVKYSEKKTSPTGNDRFIFNLIYMIKSIMAEKHFHCDSTVLHAKDFAFLVFAIKFPQNIQI